MKDFFLIMVIFIALGIGGILAINWSFNRDHERNKEATDSILSETIRQADRKIATATARFDSLTTIKAADDSLHASRQGSLLGQIKAKDRVIRSLLRSDLATEALALPAADSAERRLLARYDSAVAYRDSSITAHKALVTDLRAQVIGNDSLCAKEILALETINTAREETIGALGASLLNEKKETRRERRKRRVTTVGAVVLVLIAAVL
jgi:hypothetical protein